MRREERAGRTGGMKTRGGNPLPAVARRSSEVVAQRTPPSVHSPREFNAPGRAAIKTRRGPPRAALPSSPLGSLLITYCPDRERESRETTRRISWNNACNTACALTKACWSTKGNYLSRWVSIRRDDPFNCLLTLPLNGVTMRVGPTMGALLMLDLEN